MRKRQLKKLLNNEIRKMNDQLLIHLHMNHTSDKFWPLIDKEIRNRFEYEVSETKTQFIIETIKKTEGDVVTL